MNLCQLIGRLTKDPELRYSPSGTPVVRFTLAVNRQNDEADFISCVAFNKVAENLANFQKKGNRIAVVGRIQTGSYEKDDGQRVYTTDIIANNIEFLDYRENTQNSTQNQSSSQGNTNYQTPQQNTNTGQTQPNYGHIYGQQPNDDPFANSKGPIEVNSDDLPF